MNRPTACGLSCGRNTPASRPSSTPTPSTRPWPSAGSTRAPIASTTNAPHAGSAPATPPAPGPASIGPRSLGSSRNVACNPAGQALVDAARANGAWTISDEIEDLVIPDDLAEALPIQPVGKDPFRALLGLGQKEHPPGGSSPPEPRLRASGALPPPLNAPPKTRMANHPTGRDQGPRARLT